MRRQFNPAVASALFAMQAFATATTYPSVDAEQFEGLKAFEGTWVIDGKWANGNPFKARQKFETLLGGKFVAVRTWSASGGAAEAERDFVVYGLDDQLKLVQWVYTPDGQVRQTTASRTEDRSIQFDWTKTDAKGKTTELRTVINLTGVDTYRWRTQMHIKGEWHTLIDGEWKREQAADERR